MNLFNLGKNLSQKMLISFAMIDKTWKKNSYV
jgi:hypothetical protein